MSQKTAQNVTRVAVYHHRFADPDNPDEASEFGRDVGMEWEWCEDKDVDVVGSIDDQYLRAGVIGVKTSEFDDAEEAAGLAYEAWEMGSGRDPTATRSMAVGDIMVVDGDGAYFVDRVRLRRDRRRRRRIRRLKQCHPKLRY